MAKKELENIKIKGHTGTWYEIDRRTLYGKTFYLMESEIYGDEAPGIIIDEAHEPVIEDVFDGFDHETVSTLDWIAVYGKNIIGGKWFYGVYRLRDRKEVDHSGNRETPDKQFMTAIENLLGRKLNPQDIAEAEKIAQLLNAAPKE